jgi:hypothetical protein
MARWLQHAPADVQRREQPFAVEPASDLLVLHDRALPANALDAEGLTSWWIAAARRQLDETPLSVRTAALRQALGLTDDPLPVAAAGTPRNRVVLVADEAGELEHALRHAGYSPKTIAFTPFDAAAAAKVQYFETYNRTRAAQRALDIIAAARANPGAALVASGDVALAAAIALPFMPIRVAVLDVDGFDTSRDDDFLHRLYVPGVRRAGDFATAAAATRVSIVFHNAGATFNAGRATVKRRKLKPSEILDVLRRASGT